MGITGAPNTIDLIGMTNRRLKDYLEPPSVRRSIVHDRSIQSWVPQSIKLFIKINNLYILSVYNMP